mgnify:CR=1 FL=1
MKYVLLIILSLTISACQTTTGDSSPKSAPISSFTGDKYGRTTSSYSVPKRWTNLRTPLMDIELPDQWQFISDYQKYDSITRQNKFVRLRGKANNPARGVCESKFQNWNKYAGKGDSQIIDCWTDLQHRQYHGDRDMLKNLMLYWSDNKSIRHPRSFHGSYEYHEFWAYLMEAYAIEYPRFDFTPKQRVQVDKWIQSELNKLTLVNFDERNQSRPRCVKIIKTTFVDDCGSTRFRYTYAKMLGGLLFSNQELWDEGIDSLQYVTTIFDSRGIHAGMASRGNRAMSYYKDVPYYMSMYVEILDTLGYDFLNHTMPEGKKVHEALRIAFDNVWNDDAGIFLEYAKKDIGTGPDNIPWTDLLKPWKQREKNTAGPQLAVRHSLRYWKKYEPGLGREFGYENAFDGRVGTWTTKHITKPGEYWMIPGQVFIDLNAVYRTNQ